MPKIIGASPSRELEALMRRKPTVELLHDCAFPLGYPYMTNAVNELYTGPPVVFIPTLGISMDSGDLCLIRKHLLRVGLRREGGLDLIVPYQGGQEHTFRGIRLIMPYNDDTSRRYLLLKDKTRPIEMVDERTFALNIRFDNEKISYQRNRPDPIFGDDDDDE